MIVEEPTKATIGSVPQKRSLFNKPSWSRPQALSTDTDLFHRSNQTYADVAAGAERTRKKKLARKERERASECLNGERAGKRRRMSEDENDEEDDSSSDDSSGHSSRKESETKPSQPEDRRNPPPSSPQKPIKSPKTLLKRYEARVTAGRLGQEEKQQPKFSEIIDLEDEEDPSVENRQEPTRKFAFVQPAAFPKEDDQLESDEEFPELARQAREKARRKRLEEDVISTIANPQEGQMSWHQHMPPTSQPDPTLQILITSSIDNTIPLIFSRKLSQRLKDVRLAWAKRQNFATEFTDTVFLTWRGKRVFDVTTCRSLGITVDAVGDVSIKGSLWKEEGGKIHMEAMTANILEDHKNARHDEATGQEGVTVNKEVVAVEDDGTQVRIVLKAKGLNDFKLKVRPVCHPCIGCLLPWLTSASLLSSLRSSMLFAHSIRLVEKKTFSYPLMERDYCRTAKSMKQSSGIWTLLRFIVDRQISIESYIWSELYF